MGYGVSEYVYVCVCVCVHVCVWGIRGNKNTKYKGSVGYSSVLPQVCQTKNIHFYWIASECSPHIGI